MRGEVISKLFQNNLILHVTTILHFAVCLG